MYPACFKHGQSTDTQPAQDAALKLINLKSFASVGPCSANAPRVHKFGGRNATCSTTAGHAPV